MISSFRKKQTVRRYSGGHYDDNGEWQRGSYEEIFIMASVQPLNQNEQAQYVDRRPEGGVAFSAVKIYSSEALRSDKQALPDGTPSAEADILVWRGRLWQVILCEDWQSEVIDHYKMIAWEVLPEEA